MKAIKPPTIRPNPLPAYRVLYDLPKDTWLVINMGGRGGGKSYETSKYAAIMALQKQKRVAVLRDQQSTIQQSILNEIKLRCEEINQKSGFFYTQFFDFQKTAVVNKERGTDVVFTKGFQTSNSDQKANLKSMSDVDIAIIEEFEDIRDETKFNTFSDSIRKEGSLIVVNLNTPDRNHWFIKRYFNLQESEYDGFYRAVPRNMEGVVYTFTTYEDNPFLPAKTVNKYRAYGDPNNELYNLEYYCTAILGLVSEGRKGRIYRNWKPITLTEFNNLPYSSYAGLDFGYSSDPNACVEIKAHNNKRFVRLCLYENQLSNKEIAERLRLNLPYYTPIYADSAEPKSIAELQGYKLNIWPAIKGQDSILAGVKHLQGLEVHYVANEHLEEEIQEYAWMLDGNGNPTDKPIDKYNHALDALRYGEMTHKQMAAGRVGIKRNFH